MHVRSLDDPLTPHPEAVIPILYADPSVFLFTGISGIQVHRQIVAWVQYSNDAGVGSQIEIWDWQAGRSIWVRFQLSCECISLHTDSH